MVEDVCNLKWDGNDLYSMVDGNDLLSVVGNNQVFYLLK